MSFIIRRVQGKVDLSGDIFTDEEWTKSELVKVAFAVDPGQAAPEVKFPYEFVPETCCRILHDNKCIYVSYVVNDRYVRVNRTKDQQSVCRDSCVEFFAHIPGDDKYYNFEFSAGGAMLMHHNQVDRSSTYSFPQEDCGKVMRFHTVNGIIDPECKDPMTWRFAFAIPFEIFRKFSSLPPVISGSTWKVNFNKCADESSHPCWLSWMPLPKLSFHLPDCFGEVYFE